jgi:3-oxo-5alpha-steroid 4-dehydrogenase
MTIDAPQVVPVREGAIGQFDHEVDVVVVGGGCGGVSAAVEAATAGAEVLLLERTGGVGGASAMSGGLIYLGGGTALQTACGVEDSPEEMYKFLVAATGPGPDEQKIGAYCEGSVEHFDWIAGCGVPFKASIYQGTFPEPETDDGLMFSGGEDTYPWYEIAKPAPRAHVPQMDGKHPGERSGGWMLMHHLANTAEARGVKTRFDTSAEALVVADDGAVRGLVARQFGEQVRIRARKGVVLAAGGFIYNDELLAQHAPRLLGCNKLGTDGDDGRGILMAQAIGAAVKHMDASECAYAATTGLIAPSIVVNGKGDRFINEDTYFGRVGQAVLFNQNADSIVVFDEEVWESVPDMERGVSRGLQPSAVCATVEELEQELGLPAGCLQKTIEMYNRHAEQGADPLYGKNARWLKPLRSPFGALDMRNRGYLTAFTLGGLDTSIDGEVRHVSGDPIPGLFAAGRTTSGIPATGYLSGSSLGDGTFFGRRAGRAVARG